MAAMSSVENSQGILAVCIKDALPDLNKLTATSNLLIYCHEINDPGNLGTIIRSSHALGAQGLILSPGSVDPFSPKVVRASAGSLWQLPFLINIEFQDLVRSAQEVDMKSIAMTGGGKKTLNNFIKSLPKKSVFVFGNEAHGLPKEIITKCDEQVRIPMKAGAESLNLATSTALVIYAASNTLTPIE
jgi:TrmH family RNA methyltransferase